MEDNFFLFKDFFEKTTRQQSSRLTNVACLEKSAPGIHSVRMAVDLQPLADFWDNSLMMECEPCNHQLGLCKCLLTSVKCGNSSLSHCRFCPKCNHRLRGSHILQLDFCDIQGKKIRVDFETETMDVFLSPFHSSRVTSDRVVNNDFYQTLQWHVSRAILKQPFFQSISVLKKIVGTKTRYLFLAGELQPTLDAR